MFYILQGNNGATYIVNTKSRASISESLRFYRARSASALAAKMVLRLVMWAMNLVKWPRLVGSGAVEAYLEEVSKQPIDFNLDDDCSVLVSPTRDKIIINHHSAYFEKFAFGASYKKVRNEAQIYGVFKKPPVHFQVSRFSGFVDVKNEFCLFQLHNAAVDQGKAEVPKLTAVLLEFFQYTPSKAILFTHFLDNMVAHCKRLGGPESMVKRLGDIKKRYAGALLPLGLVHHDFKPWNIIAYKDILIFDFEEATTQGMPLEDFFNFYCDPIIRYTSPRKTLAYIFTKRNSADFMAYTGILGITIPVIVLFEIYLIKRMLFWEKIGEKQTTAVYEALFNYTQTAPGKRILHGC